MRTQWEPGVPSMINASDYISGGPVKNNPRISTDVRLSTSKVQGVQTVPAFIAATLILLSLFTPQFALANFDLGFIPNSGQVDEEVLFYYIADDATVFFTDSGIVVDFKKPILDPESPPSSVEGYALKLDFGAATQASALVAEDPQPVSCNFFIGNDETKWASNISPLQRLTYKDIQPGLDLVLNIASGHSIEYRLHQSAKDGPPSFRFKYLGMTSISHGEQFASKMSCPLGTVLDQRPESPEQAGILTFRSVEDLLPMGERDHSGSLLASTFLGHSSQDIGYDVELSGTLPIITGLTSSTSFPTTVGAYDTSHNGGTYDAFVAKFTSTLGTLMWCTFIGGNGWDYSYGLDLDSSGNPIITGKTSSTNFPTQNAYDSSHNGSYDVFVTKLSSGGSSLTWSTYIGHTSTDVGWDIAINSYDQPVIVGGTHSGSFPTTYGTYDTSHNGGEDVFVAKLSSSGSSLSLSTFLGHDESESGYAIALDSSGNPVICGYTGSPSFPTSTGAYDTSYNGWQNNPAYFDAFVAKFNTGLSSLTWSTFLGGSNTEEARSIALDASNNPHVTGWSYYASIAYPTTSGAYDETQNGVKDTYVSKLNSSGTQLTWSTFLGGSGEDWGWDIEVDQSGMPVIAGITAGSGFPSTSDAYDETYNYGGSHDAYIARFSVDGADLDYGTFLGSSSAERANGLALTSIRQ